MSRDISRLSAMKLRRRITNRITGLPSRERPIAMQNVDNAICAMFLDGIGVLKGGGSLSLRFPLSQGRTSRDLDAVIDQSIERFRDALTRRLKEGRLGFTGTIREAAQNRTTIGFKAGMRRFDVSLLYNGKPFTTVEMEAAPDHSGFIPHAMRALDGQTSEILHAVGLDLPQPVMIDPLDQLADKLHAVSNPGKNRGRDLADIAVLTDELPLDDLDDLRRRVRRVERSETTSPHEVHELALDADRLEALRRAFAESNADHGFENCLEVAQRLLRQVDVDHKDEWEVRWRRKETDRSTDVAGKGMVHVVSHDRAGHPVRDYWRRKPSR